MGNVSKHGATLTVTTLKRGSHFIETIGKASQILRALCRDAGLQVTGCNCARSVDHIREWVDEAAHQQNGYHHQKHCQNKRDKPDGEKNRARKSQACG